MAEENNSFEWNGKAQINPAPAELKNIFDFLLTRFAPASSNADADLRKTTDQIFKLVTAHYPDETIEPVHIFKLLKEAKFTYDVKSGSMEFVWLLKKSKSVVLS